MQINIHSLSKRRKGRESERCSRWMVAKNEVNKMDKGFIVLGKGLKRDLIMVIIRYPLNWSFEQFLIESARPSFKWMVLHIWELLQRMKRRI